MILHMAPIQGMTTAHNRQAIAAIFGGFDSYYAPFISTTHMRKTNTPLFKDILKENNEGLPRLVPQLLGNNAQDFRFFASAIAALGYEEINWNIGCPFHKVTRKQKGSGLLPHPDLIDAFLDHVCKDDRYKVSVKMRLGLKDPWESIKVMEVLNRYPLINVVIHGRIGTQLYEGTVDLDAFTRLYEHCSHPVIYNGDIYTLEDFTQISQRFPQINEYMLGRGALRDPFLADTIKGSDLSEEDKHKKLKDYHLTVYTFYRNDVKNDTILLHKMKEFWSYLAGNLNDSLIFMEALKKISTIHDYEALMAQWSIYVS